MINFHGDKVNNFWDNERLLEKNKEEEVIVKIVSLKQKSLNKLNNNEWSQEEYNRFIVFIKNIRLDRFNDFYDFINLYLDLSRDESIIEIEKLNSLEFIKPKIKTSVFAEVFAAYVYEFNGQILSLAQRALTSEENDITIDIKDKVSMYEDMIVQLNNPESDYSKLLKDLYADIIEKSVVNIELKSKLLSLDSKTINSKIRYVRRQLTKYNRILETEKVKDADSYAFSYKFKNMKK